MSAQKPTVQLTGEDGNVFVIIGRVAKRLRRAGQPDRAAEFAAKAGAAGSYGEVLRLTMEYAEVE